MSDGQDYEDSDGQDYEDPGVSLYQIGSFFCDREGREDLRVVLTKTAETKRSRAEPAPNPADQPFDSFELLMQGATELEIGLARSDHNARRYARSPAARAARKAELDNYIDTMNRHPGIGRMIAPPAGVVEAGLARPASQNLDRLRRLEAAERPLGPRASTDPRIARLEAAERSLGIRNFAGGPPAGKPKRFSARVISAFTRGALARKFSVVAEAGAPTEILLYDEIGAPGVAAEAFVAALGAAGDGPVHLRINSPGGDVFDAMAMYNALRAHKGAVAVTVDGIAASAASFVAMGGASLAMGEQAMLMIHNAWSAALGDRHVMNDTAGTLAKIDGRIAAVYADKTGRPAADMAALMDAETWMTSSEAKAAGFCDQVIGAAPAARAAARPAAHWRKPAALTQDVLDIVTAQMGKKHGLAFAAKFAALG